MQLSCTRDPRGRRADREAFMYLCVYVCSFIDICCAGRAEKVPTLSINNN